MIKTLLVFILTCFVQCRILAQVGIGTTTPASSAQLELSSTTKGFLPPRMTTTERNNISAPVLGLQIFNTTTGSLECYIGGNWQPIAGGCATAPTSAPNEAPHFTGPSQIVWNWNMVPFATGYKYNTVNNFNTATDNGNVIKYVQTGLSCTGLMKTLYVWAYNTCGFSPVATFSSDVSFPLTISKTGAGTGVVKSVTPGIVCGSDCTENVPCGNTVTLLSVADAGSMFTGWSGPCSGTGSCVLTMTAAQNVTANFSSQLYVLDILKPGNGSGLVTSSPPGINCGSSCSASYAPGTVVTLTATAIGNSIFEGWFSSCTGTGTCTVVMNIDKQVAPIFTLPTYDLMVSTFGSGSGTVTSAPAGINCGGDCNETFVNNTVVNLTAVPQTGSTFTGWYGSCSGTGPCSVTMTTSRNVGAEFTVNSYTLTVNKSGSGTVTSTPAGISCGSQCAGVYTHGTTVTLTAAPAGGGAFAGWSGACSGTGPCTVAMDAAKTVNAVFNP